jgi:hypothetical protein
MQIYRFEHSQRGILLAQLPDGSLGDQFIVDQRR